MHFDVTGGGAAATQLAAKYTLLPKYLRVSPGAGAGGSSKGWRPVLSVGPTKGGLAFHAHGEAWLATVRGAKLWLLFPPSLWPPARSGVVLSSAEAAAAGLLLHPPPGMLHGVVHEDEAILVPTGWHHATVNLEPTLAVGGQQALPMPGADTPTDPLHFTSALLAAQAGTAAYNAGKDAIALALLARAAALEPLNFKMQANLIAALLAMNELEEAVGKSTLVSMLVTSVAPAADASYVLSYLGLKFFEAAIQHGQAVDNGKGGGTGSSDRTATELMLEELRVAAKLFAEAAEVAVHVGGLDPAAAMAQKQVAGLLEKVAAHSSGV
jgi:hypothetical protein